MDTQRIAPYRPLPPQRWGFLPTNQFWARAWLTPISIVFWVGAAVFFSCFDLFALVWWQQALGFLVFYGIWGGLVERAARRYLARQQRQALVGSRTDPAEDAADEVAPLAEPSGASSRALLPARGPQAEPLVATAEAWDEAYARLFGRGAAAAQLAANIAFGLAIFYPSWVVKLVAFVALLAVSLGLGAWQRRRSGGPEPRGAGGGAPNVELDDAELDASERSPRALPRE